MSIFFATFRNSFSTSQNPLFCIIPHRTSLCSLCPTSLWTPPHPPRSSSLPTPLGDGNGRWVRAEGRALAALGEGSSMARPLEGASSREWPAEQGRRQLEHRVGLPSLSAIPPAVPAAHRQLPASGSCLQGRKETLPNLSWHFLLGCGCCLHSAGTLTNKCSVLECV